MHSIQNKGAIDYSFTIVSSYPRQYIILFPSESLVSIPLPYFFPSYLLSQEPTFSRTYVCDILMNAIYELVKDGSDCRNIMLQYYKDYWLEDSKFLMISVNIVSTDVINTDISVNVMIEVVYISERFTRTITQTLWLFHIINNEN